MRKYVFLVARRYRKIFGTLATKHPDKAIDYWYSFYDKLNGALDLLALDDSMAVKEYLLICKYFKKRFNELYDIYCK